MELSPNDDHWIKQRERERLAKMPTMNYSETFHVVLSLYDIVPLVQQGQYELGQAVIAVTNSLLCFLNRDLLDCLPYTIACVVPLWPLNLQSDLINMISFSLLPMTLGMSIATVDFMFQNVFFLRRNARNWFTGGNWEVPMRFKKRRREQPKSTPPLRSNHS